LVNGGPNCKTKRPTRGEMLGISKKRKKKRQGGGAEQKRKCYKGGRNGGKRGKHGWYREPGAGKGAGRTARC